MRILVIGNGGREHALAWKIAASPQVEQVYVAPGNAGTALEDRVQNVAIKATDIDHLLQFAQDKHIDLTVVGPEAPLVAGITDQFTAASLRCFGPTQAGAQLEGSKAFAKDFLVRHNIPTAHYASFTDAAKAKAYLAHHPMPVVIKADGLAAGKGVIIAATAVEAKEAIDAMLGEQQFGSAGAKIIIEEFLTGEEASFIVLVGNNQCIPLATSQDHKARFEGDTGPNTGGMGAYSPAPVITPKLNQLIMSSVIEPTLQGLSADNIPFTGFLYAGLMIGSDNTPRVLEFNCRLGDPETQPLMLRLKSDLVELLLSAFDNSLTQHTLDWDPRPALGVVMAAKGYPGSYPTGDIIHGLPSSASTQCKVFHAGTLKQGDHIVTQGGRVLCATALGESIQQAQSAAYQLADSIHWSGVTYRKDIGYRAIARMSEVVP